MKKIILISGQATSGKDTFFKLLNSIDNNFVRFSLADELKKELFLFVKQQYNIDIFNCSSEQKEMVRNILVYHAKIKRDLSFGRYFIDKLQPNIDNFLNNSKKGIAVITDIRFDEYKNDELFWALNELKGTLVHVKKFKWLSEPLKIKQYFDYINPEEAKNDPKLELAAHYKIEWPELKDKKDISELNIYAKHFIKWFNG